MRTPRAWSIQIAWRAAERRRRTLGLVAAGLEMAHHGVVDAVLDLDGRAVREHPRRVDRGLQVEAVAQEPGQEIGMAGGLVLAAHDAERHHGAPALRHHRRG